MSHGYLPGDYIDPEVLIFLDGSGGIFTKDPRLRRCGWGWAQVTADLHFLHGQSGGLQGITHTVPRAEIMALEYAIRAILASPTDEVTYLLRSDNKGVVIGWTKGARWCRRSDQATAWARVWSLVPELTRRNITIQVTKVKWHITQADIDAGHWTEHERCGNDHADRLAGLGAASVYDNLDLVGRLSATGWGSSPPVPSTPRR